MCTGSRKVGLSFVCKPRKTYQLYLAITEGGAELKLVCFFEAEGWAQLMQLQRGLERVQPGCWPKDGLSARQLAAHCAHLNFTVTTQATLPTTPKRLNIRQRGSLEVLQPPLPPSLEKVENAPGNAQQ